MLVIKCHDYLRRQVILEGYSAVSATDNFKIQLLKELGVADDGLVLCQGLALKKTLSLEVQNKFP